MLEYCVPGHSPQAFAVLLREILADRLHLKFRPVYWRSLMCEEDAEVLEALPEDLFEKARLLRGSEILTWLEDCASHSIRLTPRREIAIDQIQTLLDTLYHKHIYSAGIFGFAFPNSAAPAFQPLRRFWDKNGMGAPWVRSQWAAVGIVSLLSLEVIQLHETQSFRGNQVSVTQAIPETRRPQPDWIEIPIPDRIQLQPILLNLDAQSLSYCRYKSRRVVHKRVRSAGRFDVGHVIVSPPLVHAASLRVPVIDTVSTPIPTSLFATALPAAPKFKRRASGFNRVLSMLTVPFKTFARTINRD